MKLNIYNGKTVEKTYTASTYDLMFGTVEDVLNVVDLEKLNVSSNTEMVKSVCALGLTSMDIVKKLLMDIFPGLSEEEIRRAPVKEIAWVLIEVVRFAVGQMSRKN